MRSIIFILVMLAGTASAQDAGDWTVDSLTNEPGVYAATSNQGGGLLGKVCMADGCQWILTIKANCEAGESYPALFNADSGSMQLKMRCAPNKISSGRYIIENFAAIEEGVKTGALVGFAIPMQSGDFRVSRFAVTGWAAASRLLAAKVQVLLKTPGERSL